LIRVGISGWRYAPWRGAFYPKGLPQRRELEFAARHFPTLEINGSFYSLQRPQYYEDWYAASPPGFAYAVKGSRYVTHLLRLKAIDKPLANFFASGILALKDKLGPFLWQFPPMLPFKPERFEPFFDSLPKSTSEALTLARKRDARMKGRSRLAIDAERPLRHAVEVRHPSFVSDEFLALLRKHGIGLVVADTAGRFPRMFDVTADFVYVRLHGDIELYKSGYTPRALDEWAERIRGWHAARKDVYVYFDNDMKVRAPFDALNLMERLNLAWEPADEAEGDDPPFRVHVAGRMPRLKPAYGPRVTGGNPAWEKLGRR
jgi:uncharacterized protein YecE (DUF72 family)